MIFFATIFLDATFFFCDFFLSSGLESNNIYASRSTRELGTAVHSSRPQHAAISRNPIRVCTYTTNLNWTIMHDSVEVLYHHWYRSIVCTSIQNAASWSSEKKKNDDPSSMT